MEEMKLNTEDLNFGPCGPVCPSRVEMLAKSYSNDWTDEDKRQIRDSFKDYKGREDVKEAFIEANMRKFTCCICGCDFIDWTGCNPYPYADSDKFTCCHDCDTRFVHPARLAMIGDEDEPEMAERPEGQDILEFAFGEKFEPVDAAKQEV